jgi:hypothetical protein
VNYNAQQLFEADPVHGIEENNKQYLYSVKTAGCRGLDQSHLHPLHRASENVASQPGIEPGISCTVGEYSMKRAIGTAVFCCHSGSHLCCYSSPPSRDGGSWLNVIRMPVEYAWRSDQMHVAA